MVNEFESVSGNDGYLDLLHKCANNLILTLFTLMTDVIFGAIDEQLILIVPTNRPINALDHYLHAVLFNYLGQTSSSLL